MVRGDRSPTLENKSASDWFVILDSDDADADTVDSFLTWLNANPQHAEAFAQCETIAQLIPRLRHDNRLAWAFEEASRIARIGKGQ
jgi:ferric-dicitrate binding protein FerR (iron transport regulator)